MAQVIERVLNVPQTIERILQHYQPQHPIIDRTDGVSIEFPEWRLNLRGSNTEPLLRLNVESRNDVALVNRSVAEIAAMIQENPLAVSSNFDSTL